MKQTYRSKTAFSLGCLWLAFVAFNAWDLTARYNGKPSLIAAAVLGVITALVYVIALRPATVLTEAGLLGRNPLRSTFVPWALVESVSVSHSINVEHDGGQVLRLWTPMSSARERARAQRRGVPKTPRRGRFQTEPVQTKAEQMAAEAFTGKTHADWVGEQITERSQAAKQGGQEPVTTKVTWSIDAIAVLVLAVVLVVVAIVF
ncbi:PH domain-containing protein [Nonomuraea sp. NPDC050536]|uniref:PH domain-containing protein n=1 Tax=Nonomuraea sp. NPDC050536 TaxID=3364366 RepID=UPI0037C821A7